MAILCASLWATAQAGTPKWLSIVSPAPGEAWSAGSRHYIVWKSRGLPVQTPLRLEISVDGGKSWSTLFDAIASVDRFLWTVPDEPSREALIRLSQRGAPASAGSSRRFSILPSQAVPTYAWTNVTPNAAFAPRDGAGALSYAGRMWLLGGWNPLDHERFPRDCNNEVWSSEDGAHWSLVRPNTFGTGEFDAETEWEGRHTAGYVVFQNRMWIIGGDAIQGDYQNDVWSSLDGVHWKHVNRGRGVPWGPRVLHYAVAFKDRIWVMGGQTIPDLAPSVPIVYDDIWNSTDGIHWKKVAVQGSHWPSRGMIAGSAIFKNRIWILGGGTYTGPKLRSALSYADVWSSADGVHWERHVKFAPWEPRQFHQVAVFDDRLWVLSGWSHENRNDVWYSSDGVNWYEVPNTPWSVRHAASVLVHDNALWMMAGYGMKNDVWKLTRKQSAAGLGWTVPLSALLAAVILTMLRFTAFKKKKPGS